MLVDAVFMATSNVRPTTRTMGRLVALGDSPAVTHSLLLLPLIVTVSLLVRYASRHDLAVDFHNDFWVAGELVRRGLSPYDWSRRDIADLVSFPYPAGGALLFVPFSLIPRSVRAHCSPHSRSVGARPRCGR